MKMFIRVNFATAPRDATFELINPDEIILWRKEENVDQEFYRVEKDQSFYFTREEVQKRMQVQTGTTFAAIVANHAILEVECDEQKVNQLCKVYRSTKTGWIEYSIDENDKLSVALGLLNQSYSKQALQLKQ